MSWVKLDDGFSEHPKIAALSAEAFRAHVTALCYAGRNLTDGLVPTLIARQITTPRLLKELTKELWTADPAGFRIHDFLEYNPNRESILAKRAADSARNRGGIAAEYLGPVPDPLPFPDPAPDPENPEPGPESAREPFVDAYQHGYEQVTGKPITGYLTLEAIKLAKEYGDAACLEVAPVLGWAKSPRYYIGALEDMRNGKRLHETGRVPKAGTGARLSREELVADYERYAAGED